MTGTMLRAAVVEAINNVRTNGVRPQDFETVIKYGLEVFGDGRKVRPCVYVILDSVGGFSKEEKAATWDLLAEKYLPVKSYNKRNPMAKLDAMLAKTGK